MIDSSRQKEQRARAMRMAAELREYKKVRMALSDSTAKLKAYGEDKEGAQPVSLRDGLAARVDAILSRKDEGES